MIKINRARDVFGLSETLLLQIAAAILLFSFHLISARLLPVESYGALNFGLTLGGLLAVICALGYPNLLLRVVSAATAGEHWGLIKGVIIQAARSVVALSGLGVATLLILSWTLPDITPQQSAGFRVSAVALVFYPIGFLRAKIARGLGTISCSIVPEDILRPATFIAVLVLLIIGAGYLPTSNQLSMILLVSLLITLSGGLWCIRSRLPFPWAATSAENHAAKWRASARGMLAGSVFQEVITRSDAIALGLLATMTATAQFSACSKLALLNVFLLKVVDVFYAPKLATAFHAGRLNDLWLLIKRTAVLSLAGSLPVAIVLICFPTQLLGLFGADYVAAALPLRILAIGSLINAATGSIGYALLMSNNERQFAGIAGIVALLNVVAHLIFTPRFGMVAAAVITAVSVAVQNLLMFGVAFRRLRVYG